MAGLRAAVVLGVTESACDLWLDGEPSTARYAPQFPTPRAERVSPGHLVALAADAHDNWVVVWRWYDAVVLAPEKSGAVRLWEPAHGVVSAVPRAEASALPPGSRAYASAGLPGEEWRVACPVTASPAVELNEVAALYTRYGLWAAALAPG